MVTEMARCHLGQRNQPGTRARSEPGRGISSYSTHARNGWRKSLTAMKILPFADGFTFGGATGATVAAPAPHITVVLRGVAARADSHVAVPELETQ